LLVSVLVLTIIIFMVAQLMSSATAISGTGNKHIDTDTQVRTVFDRMATDFGRMLKRSDIDYWLKQQGARYYPGHSFGHSQGKGRKPAKTQQGSDQIAFYSQVPGYYPSSGSQSPISLVAYRVNTTTYQMERMGIGLLWNGVSNPTQGPTNPNYNSPIVFLPLTLDQAWPAATNTNADPNYETIGPGVFRFEYYYLMKTGDLTDNPWNTDTTLAPLHTEANFPQDVEAIAVTIAVIDPASRSLLSTQNLIDLTDAMNDFQTQRGKGPVKTGVIEAQWNSVVTDAATNGWIPPAAAKAIRIYNRYFDLRTL
jgi:hypothetical protein